MTDLEMFNLIMSYFPHRKDDSELVWTEEYEGGISVGGIFNALSYIMIDFIVKKDPRDISSMINLVNDFYDNKLGLEKKIYSGDRQNSTCAAILNSIIWDALKNLYSEDNLKPLFKFNLKALQVINKDLRENENERVKNFHLRDEDRFDKVLFG